MKKKLLKNLKQKQKIKKQPNQKRRKLLIVMKRIQPKKNHQSIQKTVMKQVKTMIRILKKMVQIIVPYLIYQMRMNHQLNLDLNLHVSFFYILQIKSKFIFLAKTESTNGEIIQENETTNGEENNTSIELLNKSSPTKENLVNEPVNDPPVNLRLRITPSSTSPISLTLNDSDNNNNTNEKSVDISNDQDTTEILDDDDEPIEKIEGAKHDQDQDQIVFRIKLSGQKETQWVPAKIANRKYPQAVIAFWENHVEFT